MKAPQQWDQHQIKAELHRQGMTLNYLAEMNGIDPRTMRAVWKRTHRPSEAAISKFLNVPVEQLFPDRYPINRRSILAPKYQAGAGKAAA
jgi:Ner family transcriptional regulator